MHDYKHRHIRRDGCLFLGQAYLRQHFRHNAVLLQAMLLPKLCCSQTVLLPQVETAGDCYIVSGGVMSPLQSKSGFHLVVDQHHDPAESAGRVMAFAKAMMKAAGQV